MAPELFARMAIYITQLGVALLLSYLLWNFSRIYQQAYIRSWFLALLAFAVYQLGAIVHGAGNSNALFDLGVAYSTGSGGVDVNLVEAHKWFNLAALGGNKEGQQCRADVCRTGSGGGLSGASGHGAAGLWLGLGAARALQAQASQAPLAAWPRPLG